MNYEKRDERNGNNTLDNRDCNYYNSLAELGLGRQLISFYQPK